ncbi:MAG: HAD-IA family hydrolase [Alphaproteobacteria bacterium]|nr:HAD-IA family hydrolase [Alphaproteobacteria bacterium]
MKLTAFKALTFDCYGTLIDWERGLLAAFAPWQKRTGAALNDEALLALFGEIESAVQVEQPRMLYRDTVALSLRRIGEALGAPASEAEAMAFGAAIGRWPAFPDSAEALAYLKRHYKLVVISNVDRASFQGSNAQLRVVFDAVVTAEDVGSYKPALGHFHRALDILSGMDVVKSEVLHVAQSLFHDHVPAKQLGLSSIWVDRRAAKGGTGGATRMPAVPVRPDLKLPSLAALVERHRAEAI